MDDIRQMGGLSCCLLLGDAVLHLGRFLFLCFGCRCPSILENAYSGSRPLFLTEYACMEGRMQDLGLGNAGCTQGSIPCQWKVDIQAVSF
jgi:hypothetical protein